MGNKTKVLFSELSKALVGRKNMLIAWPFLLINVERHGQRTRLKDIGSGLLGVVDLGWEKKCNINRSVAKVTDAAMQVCHAADEDSDVAFGGRVE